MSHALATVLHRGRKAASNITSACPVSSPSASGVGWALAHHLWLLRSEISPLETVLASGSAKGNSYP